LRTPGTRGHFFRYLFTRQSRRWIEQLIGSDSELVRQDGGRWLIFAHIEQRIANLSAIGVEADVVLFHPHDRWGYPTISAESDDCYLRYVLACMSAYRNIWWSLANVEMATLGIDIVGESQLAGFPSPFPSADA
jgi:hypothetical protein